MFWDTLLYISSSHVHCHLPSLVNHASKSSYHSAPQYSGSLCAQPFYVRGSYGSTIIACIREARQTVMGLPLEVCKHECGYSFTGRHSHINTWDNCRYSLDVGPIHFLQFNSELDFSPGSEQYLFIVKDLASVNRTRTPWWAPAALPSLP